MPETENLLNELNSRQAKTQDQLVREQLERKASVSELDDAKKELNKKHDELSKATQMIAEL